MRDRLEEDVGRFEVGEQQAVRIAGHRRTLDLFVLGDLLVERHVQRQRTVDDDVAQLAAVGHLGQQRAFGRGDHVGEQLLRGGDAGDFRGLDAQQVRRAGQVADLHHLLLEVGERNDRHVRDDQQFVVAGHFDDRNVAQDAFRGEQPGLLVEDAAHVFVGRDQTFHQNVGVARNDRCDGLLDAFHIVGFVDDVEGVDVDAVLLADLFDNLLVAEERRLHETLLIGFVDRFQRMRILSVSYGKTFFTLFPRLLDDFGKMLNHGVVTFKIDICFVVLPLCCRRSLPPPASFASPTPPQNPPSGGAYRMRPGCGRYFTRL